MVSLISRKLAVVVLQWFIRYSNSERPWSRSKFVWKLKLLLTRNLLAAGNAWE
jgi:hypothetical protein